MASAQALRAVAHPLRLQILSLLTGAEMSAAELARELGTTHANASYHLRLLAAARLVVPAGEERIRGGTAKRYRHPWAATGAQGADRPAAQHGVDPAYQQLVDAVATELVRRSAYRRPGPSYLSDAELWVDPATWRRCTDLVSEASTLIHDAAQPPRTDGTVRVTMSAVLFMLGDGAREQPR
ncbi:MAG: ArsR/SmtB family transcription factor [Nocardioidaceae bacterium]